MSDLATSILRELELSLLQIPKEITTLQVLHHNVKIVLVLKNIVKSCNVRVLAYLEHLDFSFQ